MSRRSLSALARSRALGALAMLGASAACNYDFDAYQGLAPPLRDSGSAGEGGAAGAGRSDAGTDAAGRSGSADAARSDAAKGDATGGAAGAAGTGQGGGAGSSGSGGASGTDAAGGTGGTAGSSGSDGAAGRGGSDEGGANDGAGGSGGTPADASMDGDGGGGAGGTGAGGTAGTGAGGTGTGGSETGGSAGTGGATPPPDGGSRPDIRVDTSADTSSDASFDCAAIGGRVYENHCYYGMSTPVTWTVAARQACVAPAHLVTITSPGEQTFVVSFFNGESRWIGYHRPAGSPQNPSAFEWITGENSTFQHWYASNGEPDYDGECVRLGPSNNWGDNPCSAAFPVICERE